MSEAFYNYVHTTLQTLSDQINDFIENYRPTNISIPGNATFGSDDSDQMTVNAETVFHGDVEANVMRINDLTVIDNMTIGQDDTDRLIVNSATSFKGCTRFEDAFNVIGNVTLGTDCTNTVNSTGKVTAPHFSIPYVSGNSLNFGCEKVIIYVERCEDTNIYTDYPNSVIVIIKNTSDVGRLITYNDVNHANIQLAGTIATYLKISPSAFVQIDGNISG